MDEASGLQDGEHQQISGEDTLSAAPVETGEVCGLVLRIDENAGDQEAGENEEELDAFLAPGAQIQDCFCNAVEGS